MNRRLRPHRLLALAVAGAALLNLPLLALWDRPLRVLGLPLLPLAIFVLWALLIGAAAWVAEAGGDDPDDTAGGDAD